MSHLDYSILVVYLFVVIGMGWYFRSSSSRAEDFFLAGRSMGWFPVGLSVMVTMFSAINYLAFPNEVFGYGLYVTAALPVFFIVAWPVTKIWMPFFYEKKLTSAYEYMEMRFDRRVRSLSSGIFIVWRLFWMATALYASGRILSALTGISEPLLILIGGLAATAYTFLGGMKAVMWTDVLQFFVLFGGIVLGVAFAAGDGGLNEMFSIAARGGRLKPFFPFDPGFLSFDPRIRMTLWSSLIGVSVAFLSRYGADQVVMQRYFSASSLKAARKGLWLNAVASSVSLLLLAVLGLAVYATAVKNGVLAENALDTMTAVQKKGMAMGQLAAVIRSFPMGIPGLVTAGLFAATMSSIDSGINACSAAIVTDFSAEGKTGGFHRNRALTICLGAAATALALVLIPLTGRMGSLFMLVNKMINAIGSPLLALFLLGMFSRRANAPGVLAGGIVGVLASFAISLFYRPLALQYYAVLNLIATLLPCMVFSMIFRKGAELSNNSKLKYTWLEWRKRV